LLSGSQKALSCIWTSWLQSQGHNPAAMPKPCPGSCIRAIQSFNYTRAYKAWIILEAL